MLRDYESHSHRLISILNIGVYVWSILFSVCFSVQKAVFFVSLTLIHRPMDNGYTPYIFILDRKKVLSDQIEKNGAKRRPLFSEIGN